MHLHELAVVDEAADHVEHVVGLAFVPGHHGAEPFGDVAVRARGHIGVARGRLPAVGRQIGEHRARVVDCIRLVGAQIVRDARFHVVHDAATEIVHADRLAGGGLDHVGPGDEHIRVLPGHDDQVGQRRAIHGAAGARSENQ